MNIKMLFKKFCYKEKFHIIFNFLFFKIKFKMLGFSSNNKVIVIKNEKEYPIKNPKKVMGLKIAINGEKNKIVLNENPYMRNCTLTINGNNNYFELGKSKYLINNTDFGMILQGNNRKLIIGNDFSSHGAVIWLEENDSEIHIGDDVMFSNDIFVRNSDGHVILDENDNITNKANVMKIGNHCWIGMRAMILKNSFIADDSIVGGGALVAKKFNRPNVVIAGNPAKIVKENVKWQRENMNTYKSIRGQNENLSTNALL